MLELLTRVFFLIFAVFVFTLFSLYLIPALHSYQHYYGKQETYALARNFHALLAYCIVSALVYGYAKISFSMPATIQRHTVIISCTKYNNISLLVITSPFLKYTIQLPSFVNCNFKLTLGAPEYYLICKKINNEVQVSMVT
ncbi:MAG: hypothetical protein GXO42_02905 [bacterium]|nr:hypothetical protein [bacterium]